MDIGPAKPALTQPRPTDAALKEHVRELKKKKYYPIYTTVYGVLLFVLLLALLVFLPSHLPWGVPQLLGVANCALAWLLGKASIDELAKQRRTFNLGKWKRLNTGNWVAAAVALPFAAWWISPLAPVRVGVPATEEITAALSDELTLAVLTLAEPNLAVIELPVPPTRARELAKLIPNDAAPFSLAVRALAESKFSDVTSYLSRAEERDATLAPACALLRAQHAVYSGDYKRAPELYEKAIQSTPSPEAGILAERAVAWALAGKLSKAYEDANRFAEIARGSTLANAGEIATTLKGAIAISQGKMQEGLKLSEGGQLAWEGVQDESPSAMAHKAASRNNQAVLYATFPTKQQGAESQFAGALTIWRDLYGNDHYHVAGNRHNVGMMRAIQQRFAEAETQLAEAATIAAKTWSEKQPGWAMVVNAQARLNVTLGRYEEAQALAAKARVGLQGQLDLLSISNSAVQGRVATGRGLFLAGSTKLRNALDDGKAAVEDDHIFLAELMLELAETNSQAGFSEAIPLAKRAADIAKKQFSDTHPLIATANVIMGEESLRKEKKADAKKYFDEAGRVLKFNEKELPQSLEHGRQMAGLAQMVSKRQWRDSLALLKKALFNDHALLGSSLESEGTPPVVFHPNSGHYLFLQGEQFLTNGTTKSDWEQAEKWFSLAKDVRRKVLSNFHPDLPLTLERYAAALDKLDRKQEADENREEAAGLREQQKQVKQ